MGNTTTTTVATAIPEIWSQEFIQATKSRLVLANLVRRLDGDVQKGDKVHIPTFDHFEANDKVANVPTSPQANTSSEVYLDVDQHKEVTFILEDIAKIQSNQNLMSIYTDEGGYAIAKAIDSSLAALASGFSQTKGTYNTAITTDVLLDSILLLDDADVPEENRNFVFKPKVKRDLMDITTYISNDFINGSPVTTGKLGTLYGLDCFQSTNIVQTVNNTDNMLFHKDALALAMQLNPRTQSEYEIADLGYRTTCDTVYGVKEYRDTFGVLVKT